MDSLLDFYPAVLAGDIPRLQRLFVAGPVLEDPQSGRVVGAEMLIDFVHRMQPWLEGAGFEDVAVTETADMSVAEQVVTLPREGRQVPLPVALAGERRGDCFAAVRTYYSMWPLLGCHRLRPPIIAADPRLSITGAPGRYHEALTRGDLEAILATFEDDGYAREPSGGPYVYQGKEKLREFYGLLFSGGGGIRLEHCTVTDDGVRLALEYNATGWGRAGMPPQAGIAIYERGPSGLLHAARIYDDVNPPVGG